MIGKIVTFWRVTLRIWLIYGILLVTECCGTVGTAVNEAYFALFSIGAHLTGMIPRCDYSDFYISTVIYKILNLLSLISIDTAFWVHVFYFTE